MICGGLRKRYTMKLQRNVPRFRVFGVSCSLLLVPVFSGGLLLASVGVAVAEPTDAEQEKQDTVTPTNVDSLRKAIEELRFEADHLREKAEEINTEDRAGPTQGVLSDTNLPDSTRAPKTPKDTVELLSKEGTHAFLESFTGRKRGVRERGYGGGIGPMPGMFMLNMRPIHQLLDVITSSSDFRNISFPVHSNYQGFFMMGITGFGALGNGLRVGGSYQSGSRSYSTRENDTTYTIEVKSSFGGLLLEKATVTGNMNWFAGGIAGGAVIDVNPSKASNLFSSLEIESEPGKAYNRLRASALLLELHGGFTYTMVQWFHVGVECSTPLFFSPSGFRTPARQSITNGFLSVNPGFRIRMILGNIG